MYTHDNLTTSYESSLYAVAPEANKFIQTIRMSKYVYYYNIEYRDKYIKKIVSNMISDIIDDHDNIFITTNIKTYFEYQDVVIEIILQLAFYERAPVLVRDSKDVTKILDINDELLAENNFWRHEAYTYKHLSNSYKKEYQSALDKINNTFWRRFVRFWTGEN